MSKNTQHYLITLKRRKKNIYKIYSCIYWATAFNIIIRWWDWVSLSFEAVLNEKPPKITGTNLYFFFSFLGCVWAFGFLLLSKKKKLNKSFKIVTDWSTRIFWSAYWNWLCMSVFICRFSLFSSFLKNYFLAKKIHVSFLFCAQIFYRLHTPKFCNKFTYTFLQIEIKTQQP